MAAVASMPSSRLPTSSTTTSTTPLNAAQFPDHATWADASSSSSTQKKDKQGDVKMDEENAGRGVSSSSSSSHNTQTDSDSDIASSRPPTPPPAESTSARSKETGPTTRELSSQEAVKEEEDASERSSWIAETQLPKLSDDELNNAKLLILDLLGWGVPPEYILERGVSHQLLYTVFTDLRLRLPDPIVADCVALADRLSIK